MEWYTYSYAVYIVTLVIYSFVCYTAVSAIGGVGHSSVFVQPCAFVRLCPALVQFRRPFAWASFYHFSGFGRVQKVDSFETIPVPSCRVWDAVGYYLNLAEVYSVSIYVLWFCSGEVCMMRG